MLRCAATGGALGYVCGRLSRAKHADSHAHAFTYTCLLKLNICLLTWFRPEAGNVEGGRRRATAGGATRENQRRLAGRRRHGQRRQDAALWIQVRRQNLGGQARVCNSWTHLAASAQDAMLSPVLSGCTWRAALRDVLCNTDLCRQLNESIHMAIGSVVTCVSVF